MVIPNLGNLFYIMLVHIALVIPHFILFLVARMVSKANRLKSKVANYVYWNGSIRFFMEGYFDFVMFALINFKMINWEITNEDFWAVTLSNILASVLLILSLSLPIILIILYSINLKNWQDENFANRYGSFIDGTAELKPNQSQWVILLIPISFFVRRIAFCFTAVFWLEFLWGQVAIQIMTSCLMVIYLQWSRPLDSRFANNMETFNEVISMFTLYLLMCFSDFISDPMIRSLCGKAFIAVICFYAAVHIFFLFHGVYQQIRTLCKKCYMKLFRKKLIAKAIQKRNEEKEKQ